MAARVKKYILIGEPSSFHIQQIDEMFEDLYQDVNNGALEIDLTSQVNGVLPISSGGTGEDSFTAGSVIFVNSTGDAFRENNSLFYWDITNGRLGVGTNAPSAILHTKTSGADTLIVERSADGAGWIVLQRNGSVRGYLGWEASGAGSGIVAGTTTNSLVLSAIGTLHFAAGSSLQMTILSSGNVGMRGVTNPSYTLSTIGTSAQTYGMERHTTSNTAGSSLTFQAGGATSGATNKNGGDLIVQPGVSTGSGTSNVIFKTYPGTAAATTDNTIQTVLTLDGSKDATFTGIITSNVGRGSGTMTNVGVANIQTSSSGVGNAADTTDDTLFTYSLPLNSMSANGKSVRVRASGTTAANGNNKQIKLWFAGTAIVDSGVVTHNAKPWTVEMEVTRIDSTHVSCVGTFISNQPASTTSIQANLAVSDLTSNASTIKVTGASTTTGAASDVVGYMMKTWFEN